MDDQITIKGIKEGLLITLRPESIEWNDLCARLVTRIDQQPSFFRGARVALDMGSRPVRPHELDSLNAQLSKRGLTLWAILSSSETTQHTAQHARLETTLVLQQGQLEVPEISNQENGTEAVLIDHTLRNGRIVRSAGHVTVIGDVNAGAEIVADGNVIVWGKVRGKIHAGAAGNDSALVCALDLAPTQLRIGKYISTTPDDKRRKPQPETASVREGRIIAEIWRADRG